tara:strand:- start:642 stop:1580 length:939 start_codon:yes stop_codon:yes gene_type:complete
MYIKQVIRNRENWGFYVLGIFIIIPIMMVIFQIPFTVALTSALFQLKDEELLARVAENDINAMMSVLEPNLNLFLMLLGFGGMLLGVFISAKLLHKNSIRELTTSRKKIDWSRVFYSFAIWGLITVPLILIDTTFISPENYQWNFNFNSFIILFAIVIVFIPIQTSAEEYLFRGYLMQGIGVISGNRWLPLLFTSVAFGLMHYANPEIDKLGNMVYVFYIGSGLFAGIMTLMDEGMELALGWHAANNTFAALLVTADWTALQTHSIYKDISDPQTLPVDEVIVPVLFFGVVLLIFSRKYGWSDWRGKLFGKI